MHSRFRALVVALVLVAGPSAGHAQSFPIFSGDPIDAASGRPYPIMPGVPLILPQPDGTFAPPIVDRSTVGDVDLVVRAADLVVGPSIPPPATTPPTALAGGTRVVGGCEIPFTVIASDGDPATPFGHPLPGPELDGIPVVVAAFADLDGDGVVGPTDDDPAGSADNARELQESNYLVGRQVAIFQHGVARGSVAVTKGAPASAGGLSVVLTAFAYIGPFSPGFMAGNVPDGPGVATLMPFFPRLDPRHVIEGDGRGGPAAPVERLGVELEPAFDPPVGDPSLGTPFALATDGSSPTIDRATVVSAPLARMRFVRPSSAASFPLGVEVPLYRGASGALWEALTAVDVPDDGPGGGVHARLVPVDVLDNVTDPPAGATATLVAGPGLVIAAPDTDGDPGRETVAVSSAAGIDVLLDDAGGAADSGAGSILTVSTGGYPTETLAVRFVAGGPPSTVTTTTVPTVPTTTLPTRVPFIRLAELVGQPTSLVVGCPARRTLRAVVSDPEDDVRGVSAVMSLDGTPLQTVALRASGTTDPGLPPGRVFTGSFVVGVERAGVVELSLVARDAAQNVSAPAVFSVPVLQSATPVISELTIAPASVPAGRRPSLLTISARVADDCGVASVRAQIDRGRGFRPFVALRDNGRAGDAVARDGVFSAFRKFVLRAPATFPVRVLAKNRLRHSATSTPVTLEVVGP